MTHWTDFLRGSNGGIEVNRLVGAFGGFAYVIGAHAFIATELAMGRGFDLAVYCLSFPAGLAAVVGGTAVAVSVKDKAVAASKGKGE